MKDSGQLALKSHAHSQIKIRYIVKLTVSFLDEAQTLQTEIGGVLWKASRQQWLEEPYPGKGNQPEWDGNMIVVELADKARGPRRLRETMCEAGPACRLNSCHHSG